MKLTFVLLIISILQVNAESFAQKITLSTNKVPLEQVFKQIRKQSGYTFLYNIKLLKTARPVNIDVKDASIDEVLKQCFDEQPFTYTISRNTVIVQKRINLSRNKAIDVSGKVTDEKGLPLPGASIKVKGTVMVTSTDAKGQFAFKNLNEGSILIVSYTGFVTREVPVAGNDPLTISLEPDLLNLTEVVVVGYGTQKKENITGAIATLDMAKKENTPSTNLSQALHGVSGLWVNQPGGQPGRDGGVIRIRGLSTIGSAGKNNPLVLVDGIEYSLDEINPATIQSVTVLKDASAAIYGSRSANGVILVTTKSGKPGRSEVNYSFSHGIQTPTFLPDVVWDPIQYMELRNQAVKNEGILTPTYSDAQIEEYRNGMASDPFTYPQINWFDYVLKNGSLQQHNLRFSGGTEKYQYSLALGYMNQDGLLKESSHANRYTIDLNITAAITDKLKAGATVKGNLRKYSENAHGTNYFFNRFTRALPIMTPYTADGKYGNVVFPTPGRNAIENLEMFLKEGSYNNSVQRQLIKVFADYKLPFGITYNINAGIDKEDGYLRQFVPKLTTYNPKTGVPFIYGSNPYAHNADNSNLNFSFYQTLNWEKDFAGIHNLSLMAGQSYTYFQNGDFTGRIYGYFDNTLTDLNAGSRDMAVTGLYTEDAISSYFSRLSYNFNEKYFLDATLRLDGSARFGPGHKWGFFHGTSAGWRIDREAFFERLNLKFIDLLKLRASYGQLGNQAVGLYSYLNTVALNQDYSFNGTISPGAAITSYSDPKVSWETTTSYNAGVNLNMLQGKFGFSFDVFKRRTTDILRPIGIAAQVGNLTGPTTNIGTVDNTGWETEISHNNSLGDFSYGLSAQVSHVKNKVVDIKGERIVSTRRITAEGSPIDAFYVYEAIGFYKDQADVNESAKIGTNTSVKPGYIKYKDQNGDGKINGDDRIITGSSVPKFNYGFNINVGYKNFSLTSFFQGVQGLNIYPTVNFAYPFNNGAGVTKKWATGTWTPENPNAKLPTLTTTSASENFQPSTFWIQDASYLRVKTLQLKYDFRVKLLSKSSFNKVSLFVNGENLFTFSKYKDFDPEKDLTRDDLYEYPSVKTYSFGLNATF